MTSEGKQLTQAIRYPKLIKNCVSVAVYSTSPKV
jgi:hypothetical protein